MTDQKQMTDSELEQMFDAARREAPQPDPALMARIEAQATQVQRAHQRRPRRSWLGSVLDNLGGWPALAGMTAAVLIGVVIGARPDIWLSGQGSDVLLSTTDQYLSGVFPGYGYAMEGG